MDWVIHPTYWQNTAFLEAQEKYVFRYVTIFKCTLFSLKIWNSVFLFHTNFCPICTEDLNAAEHKCVFKLSDKVLIPFFHIVKGQGWLILAPWLIVVRPLVLPICFLFLTQRKDNMVFLFFNTFSLDSNSHKSPNDYVFHFLYCQYQKHRSQVHILWNTTSCKI